MCGGPCLHPPVAYKISLIFSLEFKSAWTGWTDTHFLCYPPAATIAINSLSVMLFISACSPCPDKSTATRTRSG